MAMGQNNQNSTHNKSKRAASQAKKDADLNQTGGRELKPKRESDEVLGAIEGVEKQLDALRNAHEEHRKLNAELIARRARIQDASDQVESREAELALREVELAEMRQGLEDRESEIVQRSLGLEQRESQIVQKAEQIESLEASVDSKSKQIDQRVEELDQQLQGISVRKEELAKLEQQAKDRIEQDSKLESQIKTMATELEQVKALLGGRELELKERTKVVEDLSVQASQLEKKLEKLNAKAKSDEEASNLLIDKLQQQLDAAQKQIQSHDEAMQHAVSKIEKLDKEASAHAQQIKQAVSDTSRLKSIEASHAESLKQIKTLQSQLSAAQSELKSNTSQRDQAKQELQRKLDQAIQSSKQNAQDLQKATESAKAEIAQLQSKFQAQLQSKDKLAKETESKHAQFQEQFQKDLQEKLQKQFQKQFQEQLLVEQAKVQEFQSKADQAQDSVLELQELLSKAKEREEQLATQVQKLDEALEAQEAKINERSDDWITSRRQRLDTVKSLLRVQSDKVRRATDALRDRYDQCEKVLLKRAELVEAYQAVTEAQAKLAKRESKSGALLGLTGLGLVLAMIAGISWFVAGQVTPGTYASRVTIVASAGERSLTSDDALSWQTYIEQLTTDPQFIEKTAQRMKRRGIESLSIPGVLASHMDNSLDIVNAEPGKVEIEYRGNGAAPTQRILDTYALAIVSQANAARARRIDGALSSISNPVSVGESPLDTARIETAGMIFGGSSLGTFIFGGIFWRRLAKVKANFERDIRVEPLFDEDAWDVEGKGT